MLCCFAVDDFWLSFTAGELELITVEFAGIVEAVVLVEVGLVVVAAVLLVVDFAVVVVDTGLLATVGLSLATTAFNVSHEICLL